MPTFDISLPDGSQFQIDNSPGITFVVGPNGVGKSFGFKELASRNEGKILYIPPNREQLRYGHGAVAKKQENTFNINWQANDILARLWSRAIRQSAIKSLAEALLERLGFAQRVRFEIEGGNVRSRSVDLGTEYEGSKESSGLFNLPTLGAALYDPTFATIILDEPEQSLHPQAQHALIDLMVDLADRQQKHIIILTHSPTLIEISSTQTLARTYFVRRIDITSQTRTVSRISPNDCQYYEETLPGLNTYKRETFFAENAILVEGQTDRDLFKTLFSVAGYGASLGKTTLLPLGGHQDAAKYYALLKGMGVRPIVIQDRDVILPTAGKNWNAGAMHGTIFNWKGWVSPSETLSFLGGTTGAATVNATAFHDLNQLSLNLKTALSTAARDVQTNLANAATIASMNGLRLKLIANPTIDHEAYLMLASALLDSTDWQTSNFNASFSAAVTAHSQFIAKAASLDIIILKGSIENYYHCPALTAAMKKTEKSIKEIQHMIATYKQSANNARTDYSELLAHFLSRNLLMDSSIKIPHDAAATLSGKFTEIYHFVFGTDDVRGRLEKLKSSGKLEDLSPGAEVVEENIDANPPWIEIKIPLLKGFVANADRFRLQKGTLPDVFKDLHGN